MLGWYCCEQYIYGQGEKANMTPTSVEGCYEEPGKLKQEMLKSDFNLSSF
jgi:hypothetical protein